MNAPLPYVYADRDKLRVMAITATAPGLQRLALGMLGESLAVAARSLAGSPWLQGYTGSLTAIDALALHLEQRAESADLTSPEPSSLPATGFIPGLWTKV